jgi:DNA-directed RNA polymerase subunit L
MGEIKTPPALLTDSDGYEYIIFEEDHTLSDFIRYLLTQTDREELKYLVESVDAESKT